MCCRGVSNSTDEKGSHVNNSPKGKSSTPTLSKVRTFLFLVLAIDWFGETLFLGVPSLSSMWANLWHVPIPENPPLAAALSITQAMEASAKAAFFVMAVFGLRSRNPITRTVLFASMALVPPLNIAFPLRQLGFLAGPLAVATTLSIILWGSLFLFRERDQTQQHFPGEESAQSPPSRWECIRYIWLSGYSVALTLMAALFLFWPKTGLNLVFPWLTGLFALDDEALSSLTVAILPVGTQLLALAIGSWIATVNSRSNPTLRKAMIMANTVHAGLFTVLPLLQITLNFGAAYAASSILTSFVPLFACWVLYGLYSYKVKSQDAEQKTGGEH